jgi:hypothetical protein
MIVHDVVAQGVPGSATLGATLKKAVHGLALDRLDVAVAYATCSGLDSLKRSIRTWKPVSRWVIGLDDAITEPSAIDFLRTLKGASVKLASLSKSGRRFHPKYYCLWSSTDPAICVCFVCSGNMTKHGFLLNGEAGIVLISQTKAEADQLKDIWSVFASLGKDANDKDVEAYRAAYQIARTARRRVAKSGIVSDEADEATSPLAAGAVPATHGFNGDASTASLAWTEGASPSAGGRDLEFPRLMVPYFRLKGSPSHRRFRMPNGQVFVLTFTMRTDNQMWRLLFSRDAIMAAIGRQSLRPVTGGNRSDLAVIFRRAAGAADYDVDMVVIGSVEHQALIARTNAVGELHKTRDPGGRYFGFY